MPKDETSSIGDPSLDTKIILKSTSICRIYKFTMELVYVIIMTIQLLTYIACCICICHNGIAMAITE